MMPPEVFAVGAIALGAIVLVWQFLHWYDEDAAWVRTCGWCDDRVEGKGATPLVPVCAECWPLVDLVASELTVLNGGVEMVSIKRWRLICEVIDALELRRDSKDLQEWPRSRTSPLPR